MHKWTKLGQFLTMVRIGLLLYPHCMPAGLFYFLDLLETVNSLLSKPVFEVSWVGLEKTEVTCAHNIKLTVDNIINDYQYDGILLPGFWGSTDLHCLPITYGRLINELKELPTETKVWSYCTGVALHAESERLNNTKATITWWLNEQAAVRFPKVKWNNHLACIYHADGDTTTSGANGYLHIFHNLMQHNFEESVARDVFKFLVLPRPHLDYLPFRHLDLVYLDEPLLKKIFHWVDKTPASQLSVSNLADHLCLTERTLARRVKALLNMTVLKLIEQIKINRACELLVLTSQTVNVVSDNLGYNDDSQFRRTFKRITGLTPKEYRSQFKDHDELSEKQRDMLY